MTQTYQIDIGAVAHTMAVFLLQVASLEETIAAYIAQHLTVFRFVGGAVSFILLIAVVVLAKKTLDASWKRHYGE